MPGRKSLNTYFLNGWRHVSPLVLATLQLTRMVTQSRCSTELSQSIRASRLHSCRWLRRRGLFVLLTRIRRICATWQSWGLRWAELLLCVRGLPLMAHSALRWVMRYIRLIIGWHRQFLSKQAIRKKTNRKRYRRKLYPRCKRKDYVLCGLSQFHHPPSDPVMSEPSVPPPRSWGGRPRRGSLDDSSPSLALPLLLVLP